jgi:hypothetical protein
MARPRSRADRGSYPLDTAQGVPEARTRVKLPPDPYGDDEPRPGRGRRPLILLGALVALVAAIAIVNRSSHHASNPQSAGDTQSAGSSASAGASGTASGPVTTPFTDSGVPTGTADKVPVGYPHTSAGAQSAASNYVVAFYTPTMVYSSSRARLINAIADPAIASTLESQLDAAYQQANVGNGLSANGTAPTGTTFVERCAPIGSSLVSEHGDTATVSVWAVTVSGLSGTGSTHPVTEAWSTVTVTLHWTQGDWKWVSFTAADGPVPTSGQQVASSGQALQDAVNQFGGLRYAR